MNVNELKIRVPKLSKVERLGRYDKIQEVCSCESTAYNTGEQIQFELPRDPTSTCRNNTYKSNLTYTLQGLERPANKKDRKIVNVTPSRCPVPVNMAKVLHPQKDVFILKIGKKLETKDKKTDLEIELITPKAPCDKPVESNSTGQQFSGSDISKKKTKVVQGVKSTRKKGKQKGSKKGSKKGKKK